MNQFEKAKPARNEYTSMSEEAKVGQADETIAIVLSYPSGKKKESRN